MTRVTLSMLALVAALTLAAPPAQAASPLSAGNWDNDTLETFATVPILDGGRVKPLDTYASFLLLRLNGVRKLRMPEGGESLTPMEWFLDCLFYPEVARDYAHFVVDDANVISTIGAERHSKQRDRYSYNELLPARAELFRRAQMAAAIEQDQRTSVERMILTLAQSIFDFESINHFFDFTREPFVTGQSGLVSRIFPDGVDDLLVSDVIAKGRDLQLAITALRQVSESDDDSERIEEEIRSFSDFMRPLDIAIGTANALALIPPGDPEEADWLTPAAMVNKTFTVEQHDETELAVLAAIERLAATVDNRLAFKQALNEYHGLVVDQAEARGEYGKIPLEVSFYRAKVFYYAQILFVLSFLVAAISWFNLRSKLLARATAVSVAVPWALLVTGITVRSVIRGRPPISTLYETILFITAVAVVVALFMEYVNRQRIAISVAAFLGTLGIFLANRYEITNKEDTMPMLSAVLDTNFWLATHVTIINIGYAAGMLAAGIAHVFIFGKLLGIKRDDKAFYRSITRMVYGTICFGLLFAFVGTVLGGIWANYSWGRFWGWDPKENGAALICLCMLATLHARNGGYIRDMGIHIAAVFTGGVVAFSWWGVNLLGVGLHSYGFTSGIWTVTIIFWLTQTAVIALGFIVLLRDRFGAQPARGSTPDKGDPIAAK